METFQRCAIEPQPPHNTVKLTNFVAAAASLKHLCRSGYSWEPHKTPAIAAIDRWGPRCKTGIVRQEAGVVKIVLGGFEIKLQGCLNTLGLQMGVHP